MRSERRRGRASDEDHWSILKHQFALRLSLANTGRGLSMTGEAEGDSSPYSLGTSVAMGWFRDPDGTYRDIDDAPWAAGWTGWTAMWANECGNAFIHEVGIALRFGISPEVQLKNGGLEASIQRMALMLRPILGGTIPSDANCAPGIKCRTVSQYGKAIACSASGIH